MQKITATPNEIALLDGITEKIIGCSFKVSNTLGCGFLEKVYENALVHEVRKIGLKTLQQNPIQVHYDGVIVGEYFADLLVEDCVIVELKAVRELTDIHAAQCMNYLKATGLHLCLLMNFGNPRVDVKRIIHGITDYTSRNKRQTIVKK